MSEPPVLVTAPAGNVGREVVRALQRHGIPVRLGARRPEAVIAPDGAEVVKFDFEAPATHAAAMADARGLFLLRPIQITRVRSTLLRAAAAAQAAGVRHCVFLSVDGAERQPWLPHRMVERWLEGSQMEWTFLRPNHFMQNLLGPYRAAIAAGRLRLPAGDGRVSFVDCADLGEVAALAFAQPGAHSGRAYHLTGPEAVGFAELARLLSTALRHEVRYEPVSALTYFRELRRSGAPLPLAGILTGLHVGIRRGGPARIDPTLGQLLDRPPRTVAQFISDHAAVLDAPTASLQR